MKHFNYKVHTTSLITIVCCIFQNYCEMCGASDVRLSNTRIRGDNIISWMLINCLLLEK